MFKQPDTQKVYVDVILNTAALRSILFYCLDQKYSHESPIHVFEKDPESTPFPVSDTPTKTSWSQCCVISKRH